jgi:hypothetical protein
VVRAGAGPKPCPGSPYSISFIPMASNNDDIGKRGPGRPATNAEPILVRIPPDQLAELDAWIATLPDPKPSRPSAIRVLLQAALLVMKKGDPGPKLRRRSTAKKPAD